MKEQQKSGVSRRGFLAAGGACVLTVGLGGFGALSKDASLCYVRPPGAESNADLVARCNRCQRCLQACPQNIITPLPLGENLIANGTPVLDFSQGYCDWCAESAEGSPLCIKACLTGALREGTIHEENIGVAKVLSDACVAWNWVGCTICIEECPVEDALFLDDQARPVVNEDLCDGCGRCEQVCPAASLRSYDASLEQKGIFVVARASVAAQGEGAITGMELRQGEHTPNGGSHETA